jgi:hypothetical protein
MRGHIRERSPGHWAIVMDVRDPTTGRRKRKWHSFKGTKREAQVKKAELIAPVGAGDLCRAVQEVLTMVSASQQTQAVTVDRTNRAASIAYRRGGRPAFSEFGGQSSESKASVTIKATLERAAILAVGKHVRAMLQQAENDQTGEQDL